MSLNLQTLTSALAKVSTIVEKTVQTSIQEVTGPRPLQDYDLLALSATSLCWRLYSAKPRPSAPSTPYPLLTLWLLDKRALSEARSKAGLSKAAEDAFLDLVRADAARLVRIRHPGVLHVVMALDESKNAMAMVTEPVFASVANAMGEVEGFGGKVPKELVGMKMGLLEVKHGLLQVAETLGFLHNNAHLVHRSISPENVFITSSGAWKLGGFSFSVNVDQTTGGLPSAQPFHYAEYDVEDTVLPLQPSLNYTAPELVRNKTNSVGYSCDIFSLACLAYHLVASKPLLDCHNNVKMYMNTLQYLSSDTFSVIPSELIGDLQRMLSMDENSRPSALEFTGSAFFRDDTRLRALRFLDHMLERDNMQKTAFLKALSDMWKDFDSRVLRYKVLPPLCAELRNMVMQPMILPMVLTIAESQDKNDFELSTLPALVPVLSSASGETLLLLVKHAELIINKVNQDDLISHVLPLLVRAYDDNDARIQEEVLRRTISLAKQLDMQLMKQAVLPRLHGLALKTTVAAVRVNALRCLGDLVPSLDKQAILDILQTIQRCTAVDHSPPTLMCALGVANSIFKQCGIEFAAEHVVPLIFPLLTTQQLNVQQFAKYVLFIKDILRKIEEKRGIAVTESGTTEVRSLPSSANGLHSDLVRKPSGHNVSKSTSWDEDWGPTKKITSTSSDSNLLNKNAIPLSQPVPISSPSPQPLNSTSSQPTSMAFTPVGFEWPPSSSTGFTGVQGLTEKQSSSEASNNAFDDFDPFANWPPKPSSSAGSMGSSTVANNAGGISASSTSSITYSSNQSLGQLKSLQGSLVSIATSTNGLGISNPSIGQMNYRNTSSAIEAPSMNLGYSNTNSFDTKNTDLKSIFSSSNNGPALRIAPPPATAIGRGRGRNQGNVGPQKMSKSTHSKAASTEEPPILDLL